MNPNATQAFTLTLDQSPAVTSAASTAFTVGTAGSFTATATGFPAPTLSESGMLPKGVSFNPSTGVLSGTSAAGTGGIYPVTITASNGISPNATQNFTLAVKDFSFGAITPVGIGVGGSASPSITVNSLGGFSSSVALSLSAPPAGVSASLSPTSVTPSGNSTLNLSLGPSVVASTFNLTVTGVSGSLNHTATATVTVTANTSTIANLIQQLLAAGCIDNSGIGNALTSKLSAAQSYINAGDSLDAINALTALKNQLNAQNGKHIVASCTIGGVSFSPATVLLTDTQSLIDSLRVGMLADPIIGYAVNSSGAGIPGATVTMTTSGGSVVTTATTDITGFYYFATTGGVLANSASYTIQITGFPAGYTSATPPASTFNWGGSGFTLNFTLY